MTMLPFKDPWSIMGVRKCGSSAVKAPDCQQVVVMIIDRFPDGARFGIADMGDHWRLMV